MVFNVLNTGIGHSEVSFFYEAQQLIVFTPGPLKINN
jgi:hypothetical protein